MRILDLFAGIGGFSLAAHWMGWETAAFVEWEEFPQKVLRKNFPNVPIYGDIKNFHYEQERERIGTIDLVCGGFPCQPFSTAGKQKGRDDERHLWPEMLRVIRETQPSFVVGENVAGLVSMDGGDLLEEILLDLESEGYEVQPFIVPAISVGAPHRRDRIWIVAQNTECNGWPNHRGKEGTNIREFRNAVARNGVRVYNEPNTPDTSRAGLQRRELNGTLKERNRPCKPFKSTSQCNKDAWATHWYEAATRFCRVDDGLPGGVDIVGARDNRNKRLKALGNSIVPQVAYEIFGAIEQTYLC